MLVFLSASKKSFKNQKKKCKFGLSSVYYLGHVIYKEGVSVNPKKTVEIDKCPVPTCVHDL